MSNKKVKIIAEAGVNHNGSIKLAFKLVDVAKKAKADFVKFQIFKTDQLILKDTKKANYQKKFDNSLDQHHMLKKYELSFEKFKKIDAYCKKNKIKFLASVFDTESLNFYKKNLKKNIIKISSGDLNNYPFIYEISKKFKHIILSTGMSNISEIEFAIKTILYGWKGGLVNKKIISSINKNKIKKKLNHKIEILYAVSQYPTFIKDLRLKKINYLKKKFQFDVGFSDHTETSHAAIAATTLGASVIEKHITLNKKLPGPDHKSSMEPKEFEDFVSKINDVSLALNNFNYMLIKKKEENLKKIASKKVVAKMDILKGDMFSTNNLTLKRSNQGKNPLHFWYLLGKKSKKKYLRGKAINE